MARLVVLAGALLVSTLLTGCGSDGSAGGTGGGPTTPASSDAFTGDIDLAEAVSRTDTADVQVVVHDNLYEPRAFRVSPGTKVTFVNQGANPHNVVASQAGQFTDIPTGDLDPGMSASVRFEKPGVYPFHCSLHGTRTRGQRGVVVVE